MTSSAAQAHALHTTVGFRNREDLLVYRLEGEDQRSWLNGQVTGDVRHTKKGDSVYCLAVNVRGRILADVWALDTGEAFVLLVPASAQDALLASFESQIIMEDVEVVAQPGARVVSVLGPKAAELAGAIAVADVAIYPGDELGDGGVFLVTEEPRCERLLAELAVVAQSLGGMAVDEAGYELARLQKRVPRFGRDFDIKSYPQETGLKARAVAFDKGCYLGQEVVCTLENRGKLSRFLCALELSESVEVGSELTASDGATVGRVTSIVHDAERKVHLALGYVKRAHATQATLLSAGTASASIVDVVGSDQG